MPRRFRIDDCRRLLWMSSIGLIMFSLMGCNLLRTPPGTAELAARLPERFVYGTAPGHVGGASPSAFWARFRSPEFAALIAAAEQGIAAASLGQAQAVAEQLALASSHDLDTVRRSVTAATALAYLKVLAARHQLRLARHDTCGTADQ